MEFGVNRVTLTLPAWRCGRGWVVLLVLLGGQVTLILNIDWSLWWLVDSLSLRLCLVGGWLVEWWMMIRCFGFGLLVTCYPVLWLFGRRRVNCRVVWGWSMSGAGRGIWLLIPLMFLVGDWCESCFSGDQVGLLMNCYLVEVMVWIGGLGLVVVSWGYGVWWDWHWLLVSEVDDVIQASRWLCDRWSLGRCETWRSRRGVTEVTERLMMLDVELVVNLCRSSRAFSRNCCVFGIIVRFADWLIDFYLEWCGVWWLGRLFWIGNLNNVRVVVDQGSECITSTRG